MLQRKQVRAEHILAPAQSLRGGGVERALLRLAAGWLESGRRVTLVLGTRAGPLAAELPPDAEVIELGSACYGALQRRFPAAVESARPDLIFCPGNHYTSVAALARLRLGRRCPPIVGKVSNALVRPDMPGLAGWGYRRWLRLHPRFLDAVVAMSPAMAAEAAREMAIAPARVHVIANPPAQPVAGAAPVELPAGRYLLGVGRLEPQKRWDRAIAALPRLADREIALVILGEGGAREALEAQVAALGLGARVRLPGYAGDPLPAIAGAAAVVLTSDFEGVPGVIREALAKGTPVVATESSVAVRELIAAPDHGEVVPRDDPDALVAALDRRLAPGARRPEPAVETGDPVADYLTLFDALVAQRAR